MSDSDEMPDWNEGLSDSEPEEVDIEDTDEEDEDGDADGAGSAPARKRRCYYEVLGVERDADDTTLKKAYRKMALKWHPDKNDDSRESKEMMQEIQNAYSVLSDRHERAWYDDHRDSILRGEDGAAGGGDGDGDDGPPDLWEYFSPSAFRGFRDTRHSFYGVYRGVFGKVLTLDEQRGVGKKRQEVVPGFGNGDTAFEEVHEFYAFWQSFSSRMSFAWLDKWNTTEAPDRRVRRAMEKENNKLRAAGKREYEKQVRTLADFVKKRDPRVIKVIEARKAEKKAREEAQRKAQQEARLEKQEKMRLWREEQARLAEEGGGDDEDEGAFRLADEQEEQEQGAGGGGGDNNGSKGAGSGMGSEGMGGGGKGWRCVPCNKVFKKEKQWLNHEKSKKHRQVVAALRVELLAEDRFHAAKQQGTPQGGGASVDDTDDLLGRNRPFEEEEEEEDFGGVEESKGPAGQQEKDDEEEEQDDAAVLAAFSQRMTQAGDVGEGADESKGPAGDDGLYSDATVLGGAAAAAAGGAAGGAAAAGAAAPATQEDAAPQESEEDRIKRLVDWRMEHALRVAEGLDVDVITAELKKRNLKSKGKRPALMRALKQALREELEAKGSEGAEDYFERHRDSAAIAAQQIEAKATRRRQKQKEIRKVVAGDAPARGAAGGGSSGGGGGGGDGEWSCAVCGEFFPTRNAMFKHIKSTGHAVPLGEAPPAGDGGSKKKKGKKKKGRRRGGGDDSD